MASAGAELANQRLLPPFDHLAVQELTIAKADPVTGDRWTTRLARVGEEPEDWTIALAPDGRQLADRRADGAFVMHFLDTLRTLSIAGVAPPGQDETLGLAPPRFLLRFTLADAEVAGQASAARPRFYELKIGAETATESTAYGRITEPEVNPAFGRTWIFRGAAIGMLGYLKGFEVLRRRTLATFAADDVDELELIRGGRPSFYAQREGDVWTDRNHRRLRSPGADSPAVNDFLERIAHARISEFVDDPAESVKLSHAVERAPSIRLTVKDRKGRATRLLFGSARPPARGAPPPLLASISTRPGAVFRLFSELRLTLEGFARPPAAAKK